MKYVNALVAVALALGCSTVQAGMLTNPGFEGQDGMGSLDGWKIITAGGAANFVSDFTNPDNTIPLYQPWSGNYFLEIATGSAGQDDWQTASQSVYLLKDQTLSGAAAFAWGDYVQFVDGARVIIKGATKTWEVWHMDGYGLPNFTNGSWTPWSWTAPTDGTYTLEYGVANTVYGSNPLDFDTSGSSYGLFDMKVSDVPEPVSLALYVIGLASLRGMQRRRTVSQCRAAKF